MESQEYRSFVSMVLCDSVACINCAEMGHEASGRQIVSIFMERFGQHSVIHNFSNDPLLGTSYPAKSGPDRAFTILTSCMTNERAYLQ